MEVFRFRLPALALVSVASLIAFAAAQPHLNVMRQGTNVLVSWASTNGTNFTLQRTMSLPAIPGWSQVTQAPVSNGGFYSVLLPATNPANFFRLYVAASNVVDEPDDNFVDANGDGIDGDVTKAIFVAISGSDANAGTMAAPVRTLGEGIRRAGASGKHVYISGGVYPSGTLTLSNGVSIYGGYQSRDWSVRSVAVLVELVVSNAVGVAASGITSTTRLERLTLRVLNQTNVSQSTYGLFAVNSPALVLRHCAIESGRGGNGAAGAPGTNGVDGVTGGIGQPGCENSTLFCDSCSRPQGGNGGASACGRTGGVGGLPGHGGQMGLSGGEGAGGTLGGSGGPGSGGGHGTPGDPGAAGIAGGDGQPGAGLYTAAGYVVSAGASGTNGLDGNGGGGGGGGGGGDDDCDSFGSAGGGGGGGACGGTGGSGGSSGGGSFAVYAWASTINMYSCWLRTGSGGNGGAGGQGGPGGIGGPGGSGGPYGGSSDQDDAGNGAMGGKGGDGGRGGHGGGGAGGPSICLVRAGGSIAPTAGNAFEPGNGWKRW